MNSTQQAKNGFKTFIVTFLVSVLVFGIFYYLISDVSTENVSIETADTSISSGLGNTKTVEETTEPKVAGTSDMSGPKVASAESVTTDENLSNSPFADLASDKVDTQGSAVLQAATDSTTKGGETTTTTTTTTPQSTQTPVPDTGDFSITFGIVSSLSLFAFFTYIVFLNPRKYALAKFEQDIVDNLK
jgi:hypothetical protein